MAGYFVTGSAIAMGKVQQAYNGVTPGTGGNAPTGTQNVKLSAALGANYVAAYSTGTQIKFAASFWGKYYPGTYTP